MNQMTGLSCHCFGCVLFLSIRIRHFAVVMVTGASDINDQGIWRRRQIYYSEALKLSPRQGLWWNCRLMFNKIGLVYFSVLTAMMVLKAITPRYRKCPPDVVIRPTAKHISIKYPYSTSECNVVKNQDIKEQHHNLWCLFS